jgi:hypothetical protein
MSPQRGARRPDAKPRKTVQLRTAFLTVALTSVFTLLLVIAYLTSGCRLGDPPSSRPVYRMVSS